MKIGLRFTLAVLCGIVIAAGRAAPAPPSINGLDPLDPGKWHEPTRARSPRIEALVGQLRKALLAEDPAQIASTVTALRRELGPEVSRPEVKPDYVGLPDTTLRPADQFLAQWREDCARRQNRDPWEIAAAALQAGRAPNRLRTSQRMADAYLATARLLGPEAGAPFRERALAGARFIRSCQTKSGVFGYPHDPRRTDRLGQQAAAIVERGRKQGRTMLEGVWIIDDLGSGDLQFDHGVCGLLMFEAHALTGDPAFRASGVRAAEWALTRPLVANWNYNAFSARLLARAYLVTQEPRFLEGARRKFELGVLPGQTETGRWFDPHNARTQYHAILTTALADYVELLAATQDPALARVQAAATRALDNLAAQTIAFGASNAHEMLSLEAFYRGTTILGRHADWDRAARITLNVLATDFRARLISDLGHLPETVPFGLLQLRGARE
jgi:hypothetical protein